MPYINGVTFSINKNPSFVSIYTIHPMATNIKFIQRHVCLPGIEVKDELGSWASRHGHGRAWTMSAVMTDEDLVIFPRTVGPCVKMWGWGVSNCELEWRSPAIFPTQKNLKKPQNHLAQKRWSSRALGSQSDEDWWSPMARNLFQGGWQQKPPTGFPLSN